MPDAQTRLFQWEQAVLNAPLPPPSKLILLILRTYCRPGKPECWPSVHTLSTRSGLSRRTIQRHLASLCAARWIIRRPKDSQGVNHDTPTYTLRLPRTPRQSDTPPASQRRPKEGKEERNKTIRIFHANTERQEPRNGQATAIGAIAAEQLEHYTTTPTPRPNSALLDTLETIDTDNTNARSFWQRRLFDLRKAGKLQQAIDIIDYATACADPIQRRAKDLGPLENPAAWINAKTRELLIF